MIQVDKFLDRVPLTQYNCFDFVREVWLDWFGEDVALKLNKLVGDFSQRKATISGVKAFTRLKQPKNPCFVVMQRLRCTPHVGIYLDGNLFHLGDRGAEFRPLNVARGYFQTIRFYQ
jgi:hypothetical protein